MPFFNCEPKHMMWYSKEQFADGLCNTMLYCYAVHEYCYAIHESPTGLKNIRVSLECKGVIEKSVLRITVWHHEACRVMTNGDREGQIFLSNPHMNNGFFFLHTTK